MQISALQSATAGLAKARSDAQKAADAALSGQPEDLTAAALGVGNAGLTYNASAQILKTVRSNQKALFDAIV